MLDAEGVGRCRFGAARQSRDVRRPADPVHVSAEIRYGRVRVGTAVGSELVDLPVPMRAEYYASAGVGFVANVGGHLHDERHARVLGRSRRA